MNFEFTESLRKGNVLLRGKWLIAEKDDLVIIECYLDLSDRLG